RARTAPTPAARDADRSSGRRWRPGTPAPAGARTAWRTTGAPPRTRRRPPSLEPGHVGVDPGRERRVDRRRRRRAAAAAPARGQDGGDDRAGQERRAGDHPRQQVEPVPGRGGQDLGPELGDQAVLHLRRGRPRSTPVVQAVADVGRDLRLRVRQHLVAGGAHELRLHVRLAPAVAGLGDRREDEQGGERERRGEGGPPHAAPARSSGRSADCSIWPSTWVANIFCTAPERSITKVTGKPLVTPQRLVTSFDESRTSVYFTCRRRAK